MYVYGHVFFENYPTPPGSEGGKWFTVKELKDMVKVLISKQKKTRKRNSPCCLGLAP